MTTPEIWTVTICLIIVVWLIRFTYFLLQMVTELKSEVRDLQVVTQSLERELAQQAKVNEASFQAVDRDFERYMNETLADKRKRLERLIG